MTTYFCDKRKMSTAEESVTSLSIEITSTLACIVNLLCGEANN